MTISKKPEIKEQPFSDDDLSHQKENHWKVYIILASDGRLYTGITNNIVKRWHQHRNKRGAKFFYGRHPITICFLEGSHSRRSASQREYQIKQLSKQEKWQLIITHYGPLSSP